MKIEIEFDTLDVRNDRLFERLNKYQTEERTDKYKKLKFERLIPAVVQSFNSEHR